MAERRDTIVQHGTETLPRADAAQAAFAVLYGFSQLQIGGKVIACPYWMNFDTDLMDSPFYRAVPKGGKLTSAEVVEQVHSMASQQKFDLASANDEQIRMFMRQNAIGVDCSGFSYQV